MLRRHLIVLLTFFLLTVVFTYPLITQFSTNMMGTKLDNYEYAWKLWWVAHAITTGVNPFFVPNIYYPYGYTLAYGEITPFHTFFMLPLTLVFGEIATYNIGIFLASILTGWFTYVLARRWFVRLIDKPDLRLLELAAFFSGAAFAFCVYRQQKMLGHLNLVDTEWIVLALLALDLWLEHRRRRDAVLIALGVSLAALSSWYYGFMLGLLLPIYLLAYGIHWRQTLTDRRTWMSLAVVAVIVGVLCIPFLIPYLQLNETGATLVPVSDAGFWAASPTDYIVPNPLSPFWGQATQHIIWPFPTPMLTEFMISIGWVVLLFGLYGSRLTKGQHWRALKWVMAAAFVLSLGPDLYLSRLPLNIPLPDLLLRRIIPYADSIRSWGRFSLFVMLGFSLTGGAALLITLSNVQRTAFRRARYALTGLLIALMLIESWGGIVYTVPIEPRPVDAWLAQQPDNAPIMEFPLSAALSGPGMYYTRFHGKPVTFGYGTYLPFIYEQRFPMLKTFPSDAALDQLQAWGVHYILVTDDTLEFENFTMADVNQQPRLQHVITLDDVAVYRLKS
ncbi:MAG TPA: hypothetical protein VHD90_20950 [Phototrophicaceae bacterium]|nr:hypothetical protein [Phototrophicaceae bacterium]